MKMPEEIKKSLECMMNAFNESCDFNCGGCPVYVPGHSNSSLAVDALAYIQQLERERDAAVADLHEAKDCTNCKNECNCKSANYDCKNCNVADCPCKACRYEWRGAKEE